MSTPAFSPLPPGEGQGEGASLLIDNFAAIAAAPGGIKKLRELILELAVRGRLVPQDLGDEAATKLLERIQQAKADLIKAGKIRKDKELPGIGQDEMPFDIPRTWAWVRLAALGQIVGGSTPKSDDPRNWDDNGTPWLTPADLYGLKGKYIGRGRRGLSKCGLDGCSAQVMPEGTVLFSSRAPIGYVAIATNSLATNQGFKSCVPYVSGLTDYLYWYLKRSAKAIDAAASGTTFREISGAGVALVMVPLPPLAEQHRIVTKVDELIVLCDQLESGQADSERAHQQLVTELLATLTQSATPDDFAANWQRLSQHFDTLFTTEASIDTLKQTILQLAVMGKLVPQDPNDEPARELLRKMQTQRSRMIQEGLLRKEKPLDPVTTDEMLFELPSGWEWARLGQLVMKVSDGPHFSPKYVSKEDGVPFLSGRNIRVDGWELESAKYVSYEDHKSFSARTKTAVGDVLYTKGGTTGVAKVNDLDFDFSVWVHVAVLNMTKDLFCSDYLAKALNSPHCYALSQKYTHGSSNKDLGLTRMILITVPVPPLAEQFRIVTKVDELMSLCNTLKSRLTESRAAHEKLSAVLIEQAVA